MTTFGAIPLFNLHRRCETNESILLQNRDHLESALLKATKRYEDLLVAYQELTKATVQNYQPQFDMSHLFAEREVSDDKQEFLTPPLAAREGEDV